MGFILGNDAELSLDNPGPPCVTQHPQIHMLTTHPLPVFSVPEDNKFFCRSRLFLSTTSIELDKNKRRTNYFLFKNKYAQNLLSVVMSSVRRSFHVRKIHILQRCSQNLFSL